MNQRKLVKKLNLIFLFITGLGSIAMGLVFISDPTGRTLGMNTDILPKEVFPNFLIPGLFLFIVIGLGQIITALLAIIKNCVEVWKYISFMGFVLVVWIVVQIWLIGYVSILQPIFLVIGIIELILGVLWKRTAWRRSKYHF